MIAGVDEEWRPVPDLDFYEVSSHGRVRTYYRASADRRQKRVVPRLMSIQTDRDGYHYVKLWTGQRQRKRLLHRLVLEVFIGPCPEGMEAAHLNGNRSDNRLSNLVWATHQTNCAHKARHGTLQRGERHGRASIDDAMAERIVRELHHTGATLREIAEKCGVTHHVVSGISTGRWAHVLPHLSRKHPDRGPGKNNKPGRRSA